MAQKVGPQPRAATAQAVRSNGPPSAQQLQSALASLRHVPVTSAEAVDNVQGVAGDVGASQHWPSDAWARKMSTSTSRSSFEPTVYIGDVNRMSSMFNRASMRPSCAPVPEMSVAREATRESLDTMSMGPGQSGNSSVQGTPTPTHSVPEGIGQGDSVRVASVQNAGKTSAHQTPPPGIFQEQQQLLGTGGVSPYEVSPHALMTSGPSVVSRSEPVANTAGIQAATPTPQGTPAASDVIAPKNSAVADRQGTSVSRCRPLKPAEDFCTTEGSVSLAAGGALRTHSKQSIERSISLAPLSVAGSPAVAASAGAMCSPALPAEDAQNLSELQRLRDALAASRAENAQLQHILELVQTLLPEPCPIRVRTL
jgi:hypothetical protein